MGRVRGLRLTRRQTELAGCVKISWLRVLGTHLHRADSGASTAVYICLTVSGVRRRRSVPRAPRAMVRTTPERVFDRGPNAAPLAHTRTQSRRAASRRAAGAGHEGTVQLCLARTQACAAPEPEPA